MHNIIKKPGINLHHETLKTKEIGLINTATPMLLNEIKCFAMMSWMVEKSYGKYK